MHIPHPIQSKRLVLLHLARRAPRLGLVILAMRCKHDGVRPEKSSSNGIYQGHHSSLLGEGTGDGFGGFAGAGGTSLGRRGIDTIGGVTDASCTLDLRSLISIRRRSRISPGIPVIARVSSVFTSCAPESGMSL